MRILAAIATLCAIGILAGWFVLRDDNQLRDGDPRHASRGFFRGALIVLAVSCVAIGMLICSSIAAHARQSPYPSPDQFAGDRYSAKRAQLGPEVAREAQRRRAGKASRKRQRHMDVPLPRRRPGSVAPLAGEGWGVRHEAARVIGGRPQGCPSRFCGCGASLHLFGRIIPALNLAANWLRFPRAAPAPGMVAARRGHVFVLKGHIAGNMWLVHDSNSGRGRTRMHPRSIAGYTIVNPRGA